MITLRPADERGSANFGWLDSRHSFSFGSYYEPNYMGFGNLRVINEDKVIPGQGFTTHSHRDMEIISYVIQGELEHKDSIGNGSIIRPGDVQRMSAGTGIAHSEYNPSSDNPVHFLQIWIIPEQTGLKPSYEQKAFTEADKQGKLRLVGSQDGRDGSVTIHQDVDVYSTILNVDETVTHNLATNRSAWLQVVRGEVAVNDRSLNAGDGAAIVLEDKITLKGLADNTEVLLFDLV
ncbi:MAG: pirin family protein [Xenococcaceae cyanobacterium MO_234.B1]|nr:pirin family protein [Xenococcaceae cyanobacterium MO_234.B1]